MKNYTLKSTSELVAEGWDINLLYQIAHIPNSPTMRLNPRGKIYFVMEQMDRFIEKGGVHK